ncbi:MAG: MMPL family transporter [Alphaproteobacteria bacterium]|nr:MMPL family transporter [Alphaproteobacteria bacterium]
MLLSDISIKRPVFASVISLLLVIFGLVSFDRLPLREYPDIDPPVVTISTNYPGASSNIVERRITEVIEERISGVEGIKFIESTSQDGESRVTLEFNIERDIDAAANDVRDRISRILDNLPEEADPPEVQKADSSGDVIIWFNLTSDRMSVPELTDYAERYMVERFSVLDGVAQVRVGGAQTYAMRIWINRKELAARNLTVNDVENALRAENVELPAGSIESLDRHFTVRVKRSFRAAQDFRNLVLGRGDDGYLIRLGDIAKVEKGLEENRTLFRGNGVAQVGIGISKQSKANTIDVARGAKAEATKQNQNLPEGMKIEQSYDTSVFIERAIEEVYITLGIAMVLVVVVIYAFLRDFRATLVPAVAVPISIIATFTVINILGFSINLLTLFALVLAIGLVVDDAIVVLENIVRRRQEERESPLVAALRGTRQVGFAVIATTAVLIAIFVPIAFLEGDVGRLFSEFALTLAAAVFFSSVVSLTLSPVMASLFLRGRMEGGHEESVFLKIRNGYAKTLQTMLKIPLLPIALFCGVSFVMVTLYGFVPKEYTPKEDRGAFSININGPEGASFAFMKDYVDEIEKRLMSYVESGEITRLIVRAPRSFGNTANFNTGAVIVVLKEWGQRRSAWDIMDEIRGKLADLSDVRAFPVMRQGFAVGTTKPVQFVIGGGSYAEIAKWRDILLQKINENNPGLISIDWDYKETKPQFEVNIDYNQAATLGVTIQNISRTLETMLGSRRVTTYVENGEEYDVMIEGAREEQRSPTSLENIYVRSDRSGALIPLSNLVDLQEYADSTTLNRYNRIRSITIDADLAQGYTLGEALTYMENLVRENLPEQAVIDYKGQSQDYKYSGGSIFFVFLLGLFVMFLVMAAQFESYIHPLVIIFTVPLALAGGLVGLFITGGSLNIFSQIGLIMVAGIAAKNGILIVEFANQLRDEGEEFIAAIIKASALRLRPILMTSITAVAGAAPLAFSHGAGSEAREALGVVVMSGVGIATLFTLFIVPAAYALLARFAGLPHDTEKKLNAELATMPTISNTKN